MPISSPRHRPDFRVLVTVPNLHWIHVHVVGVLLRILRENRYPLRIEMPSKKPYEDNLHNIVNMFMDGAWTHWLSIDADNPPTNNPMKLVDLDKDIIGLPTPVWHHTNNDGSPVYWNAYDHCDDSGAYREHMPRDGMQYVDAIGTGCFLISRRVFENPQMRLAPFARQYHPDGTMYKGNDISFCERARENSFEIYCHYDYPCRHFKELDLHEMCIAFQPGEPAHA